MPLDGFVESSREDVERYTRIGAWPNIPFGDMLDTAAELHPDKEALVDDRSRLTFLQLKESVDGLALGFARLGIDREDCVLLQLPNWSEFVCTFFALLRIGATAVLLLPRHGQTEVGYFAGLTKAKAWILPERHHNTEYGPLVDNVRAAHPCIEHVVLVRAVDTTGFVRLEEVTQDVGLGMEDTLSLSNRRPSAGEVASYWPPVAPRAHPKQSRVRITAPGAKRSTRRRHGRREPTRCVSSPLRLSTI